MPQNRKQNIYRGAEKEREGAKESLLESMLMQLEM